MNYFTQEEIRTHTKEELFLQATFGLESCQTKKEVVEILSEIYDLAQAKLPKLTQEQMIERINALEEELFLTMSSGKTTEEYLEEASRLKMLILTELELI